MFKRKTLFITGTFICLIFCFSFIGAPVNSSKHTFRVIAFCGSGETGDLGHLSFIHEANRWFSEMAQKYNFIYDSTDDWNNLNELCLSQYQVVIFLDSRPDSANQRTAFKDYMEKGGAWMGFHFAAFALNSSAFPQNWDWYHNIFLGSGEYKSNTWRPTSAILRVEDHRFAPLRHLPDTFRASPNEWYRWKNDLRTNNDISILLSIDSASFPLGTGPKLDEIWHHGYYPVVWTNKNYRMIYLNMGHNDIDYEGKTNRELSHTFGNIYQDQLIINGLLWLGRGSN